MRLHAPCQKCVWVVVVAIVVIITIHLSRWMHFITDLFEQIFNLKKVKIHNEWDRFIK